LTHDRACVLAGRSAPSGSNVSSPRSCVRTAASATDHRIWAPITTTPRAAKACRSRRLSEAATSPITSSQNAPEHPATRRQKCLHTTVKGALSPSERVSTGHAGIPRNPDGLPLPPLAQGASPPQLAQNRLAAGHGGAPRSGLPPPPPKARNTTTETLSSHLHRNQLFHTSGPPACFHNMA
jgi:hypothetical protein